MVITKIVISKSPFPKHHPIFWVRTIYILQKYLKIGKNKYKETTSEIVEIADFRTNYKEKKKI